MPELSGDRLTFYLWSALAWVDQMAEEYRDPETPPARKAELHKVFRELYEFLTEIQRNS